MKILLICCSLLCVTLLFGTTSFVLCAEESPPAKPAEEQPANSERAASWITQLDAESFAERELASEALAKLGAVALPPLEQVVRTGSVEAASRAYQIIVKHFEANGAMRIPARESLQKLAEGESAVSRRSRELLNPPQNQVAESMPAGVTFFAGPGVIRFGGVVPGVRRVAVPRLAAPLDMEAVVKGGAVARSIAISHGVDTKSVELREGTERHIKIVENADKTITGEITKPKDGKPATEKIDVKDVAELKTKFPEAFELYEKHLTKKDKPAGVELGKAVKREEVNRLLELFEKKEGLFLEDVQREREKMRAKLLEEVERKRLELEDPFK